MIEYLTNEEINLLKKDLRRSYISGFLIGLMLIMICLILILFTADKLTLKHAFLILGIALSVLAFTYYFTKELRFDISKGVKELIEYEIIDKSSFEDDDPGLGGFKITHHLKTNYKKFSVDKELYEKANIQDHLIEHLTPITRQSLKLELKNNASLQQRV
jgi:hypothetical protein